MPSSSELNRDWRGIDKSTNVLSFPQIEPFGPVSGILGDIILARETLEREATEHGKSASRITSPISWSMASSTFWAMITWTTTRPLSWKGSRPRFWPPWGWRTPTTEDLHDQLSMSDSTADLEARTGGAIRTSVDHRPCACAGAIADHAAQGACSPSAPSRCATTSKSRSNPRPPARPPTSPPPSATILQNVLSLGEKRVEDVMVPRADIEAIDTESTPGRHDRAIPPGRPLAHPGLYRQHRQHHRLHPRQGRAAPHHRDRHRSRQGSAGQAGLDRAQAQAGQARPRAHGALRAAADAGGRSAPADAVEARPHGHRHRRIWRHRRRRHHRGSARSRGRRDRGRA